MSKYKVTTITEYIVEADFKHEAIRKVVYEDYLKATDLKVEVELLNEDVDENAIKTT